MLLNEYYKLERSDPRNIDLYKRSVPKDGKNSGNDVWKTTGQSWPTWEKAVAGAIKTKDIGAITYQGDVDAVLEELSKVARMIDRISEDVSRMAPRDFCVGCPVKKLKEKNNE